MKNAIQEEIFPITYLNKDLTANTRSTVFWWSAKALTVDPRKLEKNSQKNVYSTII